MDSIRFDRGLAFFGIIASRTGGLRPQVFAGQTTPGSFAHSLCVRRRRYPACS